MPKRSRPHLVCALSALSGAALATLPVAQAVPVYEKDGASVELYGILDAGIGYLEHSWSGSDVLASTINSYNLNASPRSFTGLYSGGISMSRVGLRGEMPFGSGQKAFFRVETTIDVTTGVLSNNGQAIYNNIGKLRSANSASAIDGQWDSRAAYAGFSDPTFGSVQIGRTTNFSLDQVAEFDPVQAALLYSPLGYSGGIGGGLGATENSRLDGSIKYENRLAGLSFGGQYKLAGDKNAQSAGYGWVGMLGYAAGPLSFKATVSEQTNSVVWPVQYSNVVPPDANLQIENTKGAMLTAMYKVSEAGSVRAGYENLTVWAPSNPNLTGIRDYFGLILPKAAVNASGEQHFGLWWVGGDYHFTKAFGLCAGFYDINTYNRPENGKNYLATAYSLLADYNFTKSFDGYVGIMLMQYSGPGLTKHSPTDAYSSNGVYGVGLRYRF